MYISNCNLCFDLFEIFKVFFIFFIFNSSYLRGELFLNFPNLNYYTLFQLFVPVINKLNKYCLHEILLQYKLDMQADKYKKLIILNQFTYHMYSQSKTVR